MERSGAGEQIRGILNYTNCHARNSARRRECGVGESKVFLFGDWNVLGKR